MTCCDNPTPHRHTLVPSTGDTTCILDGSERADGYDRVAQLARRTERWLDDLVLDGAMTPEDRRLIHLAYGPGEWTWRDPAAEADRVSDHRDIGTTR